MASLQETLATAQRTFTEWAKRSDARQTRELLERLSSTFFKLLDELTIARSRKHIERYYPDSLAELGGFPERGQPQAVYANIDLRQGGFMSYDDLNDEISKYQLSLFNPSRYVLPQYRSQYEGPPIREQSANPCRRSFGALCCCSTVRGLSNDHGRRCFLSPAARRFNGQ